MESGEKRNNFRIDVVLSVNLAANRQRVSGEIRDVSIGGALVVGPEMGIGTRVDLEFELPDGGPPLRIPGVCARRTLIEDRPALGVEYLPNALSPEQEARLSRFVRQLERARLAARAEQKEEMG